jgi:uncharacterized protein YcbX
MMWISALFLYPVKSARGLPVEAAEVGDRGFVGDRRFMLVDEHGNMLTQRGLPRLALLHVSPQGERLRLTAPGVSLEVPMRPTAGSSQQVTVWRDTVGAWSLGPQPELSAFLGVDCELVYMPDETDRGVDTEWAPPGFRVSFADGYPYLLTTTASLAELGRRGAPVEMIRFRPNLVVDGTEPFAEDGWKALRIGGVRFLVVKPCARCSIPTVNPETAEVGREPTRTLATFRKVGHKILFGQNLIAEGRGVVRVGDEVIREA